MAVSPIRTLLRERNFMLVWWAGLISWTGNGALFIALPVYVYGETGSTLATALSVMAGALAGSVLGPLAGVYVDRWDKRRTMLWTNLALAGVTLLFLTVLHAPWWWTVPVAFLQSATGQLLGPAENALLPMLVGTEHLAAANSLNALNNNLARLLGPAAGGVLIAHSGFAGVVVADALSYLLAAGLVWLVRGAASRPGATGEVRPFWREWRAGLQVVRHSPILRLSFIAAGLVGFGEGFVSTLMAPWMRVTLRGGGLELGQLMSVQAVGGIAAGALLAGFARRVSAVRLLGWGGLASGLLLLAIFNAPLVYPALWPVLALTAVAGLAFTAWGTAQLLLVQTGTEPDTRGRVFSLYFALFGGLQFLGMAVSGVLGDRLGVLVINVDAAAYLLAGALVFSSVRPTQAPTPPGPPKIDPHPEEG